MLRFEKLQRGTDCTGLLAAFLDETATRRAARQRLDAKRAAAGKQIQAARAINTRCEPIAQGLPATIGSWPPAIGRIALATAREHGSASCRERGCQSVSISGIGVT